MAEGSGISKERLLEAIEQIDQCTNEDGVLAVLLKAIEPVGLERAAIAQIVNPMEYSSVETQWKHVHNVPTEWFHQWLDKNSMLHDPVIACALTTTRPFWWSDAYRLASAAGYAVTERARDIGMNEGIAIPVRSLDGPPGLVTLGGFSPDLSSTDMRSVHMIATHAFSRIEAGWEVEKKKPVRELTERETEIMHWVAAGKTNWEIGTILSISVSTVEKHVAAAKEKLNATTKAMAIVRGLSRGVILPS
ncbi:MAG: LuxR family transcriptional regulator [Pseudomonadota bacterium]